MIGLGQVSHTGVQNREQTNPNPEEKKINKQLKKLVQKISPKNSNQKIPPKNSNQKIPQKIPQKNSTKMTPKNYPKKLRVPLAGLG